MPVTNYVWDPVDDNVVLETDNTNATTATYTHEPGRYGGLISQRRGATDSYYHYDGLGSTRELTSDSETVTDTNLYDAWGVNVDSSGSTENPFRYVGQLGYYYDTEASDYYVRARVYQPAIGRWWSVDPLRFLATGLNGGFLPVYFYSHNGPTMRVDPSGLREIPATGDPNVYPLGPYIGRIHPDNILDPANAIIRESVLQCPKPCPFTGKCKFKISLSVECDPKKSKHPVTKLRLEFSPPHPNEVSELAPSPTSLELCACYGGFERVKENDKICWTIPGDNCCISQESFASNSPRSLLPKALSHKCRDSLKITVGTGYGDYEFENASKMTLDFSIKTQCFCGIGHVELPGMPPVPDGSPYKPIEGRLSLRAKYETITCKQRKKK